ncbi:MAG: DUF2064 domain-containing protein [Chitinophagaceae bacterium]|nr:DUF2064 domain-containing protein [Chitinophagaceae bacterium]
MAIQQNNTALLLFSRRSEEESLAKNFLPFGSAAKNKALTQKIIDRSVVLAKNSGLPFFVWDEKLQLGDCFGERLANAIASVFEKGFEKLIVIGNDCLQLTALNIQQAATQLENFDQVIAPTKKGGVSLMGFRRSNFNQKDFENIRWQTTQVYNDMLSLANATNTSIFHFPFLNDVNNNEELQHELRKLSVLDSCKIFIQSILASFYKRAAFCNLNFFCNNCLNASGLRAPPASFQ